MIFKPRSKSNKNCSNETTKNKKKKTKKENNEEDTTTSDREKVIKVENRKENATNRVAAKGSEQDQDQDQEQDLRCEGSMGELDLQSEAGGEEDAAETVLKKEGEEEETVPDVEASPEPLGTAEEIDIRVTMEAQSETKEKEDQREAEDDGVIANGTEMDGDEEGDDLVQGEPAGVEGFSKEIESSGQNPEELQESV